MSDVPGLTAAVTDAAPPLPKDSPSAIERLGSEGILRTLARPLYWLYERRLDRHLDRAAMPKHIGLILDGNRRFARRIGLDVRQGHSFGVRKLKRFLSWCLEYGVGHVTLFVFSTENFNRAPAEVQYLLDLFVRESAQLLDGLRLETKQVRVKIIGQRHRLPPKVLEASEALEVSTADHQGMLLTIALAYGGREEIVDAVKTLLNEADAHGKTLASVAGGLNAAQLSAHLYTAGQPDPDFIIRTSGEQRLSGFLLWQSAYSELYFCDVLWPRFRRVDFLRALRNFQQRERRYGN
ncbi:MAG TPA: polyprenyl diphosphate synthase [Rhodanobacteraceae bacterium]